jgi:hypothetical protein
MGYFLKVKDFFYIALQQSENRCKMRDDFDRNARVSGCLVWTVGVSNI